jgi:5-methyltetrahydrofolate--homocysteine methyltransferase
VLLMDGAMGTELQRAGVPSGECGESWNLTHPESIRAIHRAYVDAGAEVLLTNTFQAYKKNLNRWGLADRFGEVWAAAVNVARSAIPKDGWVLADLGPFELQSPEQEGRDLAAACAHVDGLLIETLSSLDGGPTVLHSRIKQFVPTIPCLVSFTYVKTANGEIRTLGGEPPEKCASLADGLGANALGVNCGREIGMTEVIEVVRRYRNQLGDRLPLFARPNAGTPTRAGNQWIYAQTPERMADRLPELLEAGVSMVGGCCGTTPEHIAQFKRVVDAWNAR